LQNVFTSNHGVKSFAVVENF